MPNCLQLIQLGLALHLTSLYFTTKSLTLPIVPATLQNRLDSDIVNILAFVLLCLFLFYNILSNVLDVSREKRKELGPIQ